MSKQKDNFLSHNFHDSLLKGLEKDNGKATLVIDTDIYWHPGKPFTLIKLVNPDNTTSIKELVGGAKHTSMSIKEAVMKRSSESDKNFKLKINFHSGSELELHCYNFWVERVEEYKNYQNTTFR